MQSDQRQYNRSPVQIYALTDPDTDEVRYVGKARDAKHRLASHYRDARHRKTKVYAWINSLASQSKTVGLRILEEVAESDWEQRERHWIAYYRTFGQLTNLADGGNNIPCSIEQRAKNGRHVVALRAQHSPQRKRITHIKHMFNSTLRSFMKRRDYTNAYIVRFRMRCLASILPKYLGHWSEL